MSGQESPLDAKALASEPSDGGGTDAYLAAVRSSAGIGVPHDLNASLSYLQQAAERGHRKAQAELAALVGNWRLTREIASGKGSRKINWSHLRAAVDVGSWTRVPDGRVLSSAPRIAAVQAYLPAPMCDWLVRLGQPHLKPAQIYHDSGDQREDPTRDNTAAMLGSEQSDTLVGFVRSRIAALANVQIAALEPTQILRYEVGQQFSAHVDFFDVTNPALAREAQEHGQRALTVLVYLNEDYEGGATSFPDIGLTFKGRKGDALVFWNLTEDGKPDWHTNHIGTAPTRGVKWLLSQWIRIRVN